jgi:aryl-alcohol dehydrogenase-like predicted oxidoreductase
VEQLRAAQAIVPIATVQNLYNVTNRQSEALLDVCTAEGIGFIPWFPIAAGALAGPASAVADVAAACGATTAQVSLAWLLQRSPVVLPIPGTGSIPHLEENCGAGSVTLSTDQMERLSAIAA